MRDGASNNVPRPFVSLAIGVFTLLLTGCATTVPNRAIGPVASFDRDATLIYIPGVGGDGPADKNWARGLRSGGFAGSIETHDWTGNLGPISALWDHSRQRSQGWQIARHVCRLRAESPSSPIVLAAHSGGAGVAVRALEDLPPNAQVDGLVLLAPALSRTYDLTRALRHVRGRVDVFCSDRDTLVLAIGTTLFGTVDGVHGEAAGHGGFLRPAGAPADEYAKLHTHYFSRARQDLGDDGGHYGTQSSAMAALLVAPLLPRSPPPASPIIVPNLLPPPVYGVPAEGLSAAADTSHTFPGRFEDARPPR